MKEPTTSDWRAFCKHVHRVRTFEVSDTLFRTICERNPDGVIKHIYQNGSSTLATGALEAITRFICLHHFVEPKATGLFPRLTELQTYVKDDNWLPEYLPYICGTTLQTFSMIFGLDVLGAPKVIDGIYAPILRSLPAMRSRWTRLISLKLSNPGNPGPNPIDAHIEEIGQWLKSLTQLERLQIPAGCHSSLVQTLSEMPLLRTLELVGHGEPTPDNALSIPRSSLRSRFQSLEELSLTTFQPGTPMPFLQNLKGSNTVTKLSLFLAASPGHLPTAIHALATIEAVMHLPAIRFLEVDFDYSPFNVVVLPEVPPLDTPLYVKLFRLRHLRHLKLKGLFNILITDQDLRDSTNAWPELEDIQLTLFNPPFAMHQVPIISLVGVQALYNGCPKLKMIDLPVSDVVPIANDALDIPVTQPQDIKRTSSLENLVLTFYCIGEDFEYRSDEYMPMVIHLMFPQVTQLKTINYDEEDVYPPGSDDEWWQKQVQTRWGKYRDMELEDVKLLLTQKLQELSEDVSGDADVDTEIPNE